MRLSPPQSFMRNPISMNAQKPITGRRVLEIHDDKLSNREFSSDRPRSNQSSKPVRSVHELTKNKQNLQLILAHINQTAFTELPNPDITIVYNVISSQSRKLINTKYQIRARCPMKIFICHVSHVTYIMVEISRVISF